MSDEAKHTAPRLAPDSLEGASTFVRAAGLVLEELSDKLVTGHIELNREHHTPWGIVHGGVYATAIESAASIGASTAVRAQNMVAVGLTNTTHFLRSVTHGRVHVQRKLLFPGGLVWGSGGLFLLSAVTTTPDYLAHYLPAVLLTGFGVSLCLPQLSSVSVQGLPADSFGAGSAVNQAMRNLGATLGVALVVAFTSHVDAAPAIVGFRHVWWLLALSGVLVSALSLLLPRATRSASSAA